MELTRELFRKGLLDGDQHQLLALILARLGYFATEPEDVKPDLLCFGNWILAQCGILHPLSPDHFAAQVHDIAAALARTANNADLADLKTATKEEK